MAANTAGRAGDTSQLSELRQLIGQSFGNASPLKSLLDIYYYQGKKSWLPFARATLAYAGVNGRDDVPMLRETAVYLQHFVQDHRALALGVELMERVTQLAYDYDNLLLRAKLENRADRSQQALETAEEALRLATERGEDGHAARELIESLGRE